VTTRVYVASTPGRLRAVLAAGRVGPAPFVAHAVTAAVRDALADVGEEEWEYAAATVAAQSSVALLRDDEPARRVVLAVDVPAVRALPDPGGSADPTLVEVAEEAPLRRLAAVLADSRDAEQVVAAARDAVARRAPEADRLLERCTEAELGWWAAQEVDVLLEDVDG
jgi:hypothetical protein